MVSGIIRLINKDQGFGIIINESGKDINFFSKDVIGEVNVGDQVKFIISDTSKGEIAIDIKKS